MAIVSPEQDAVKAIDGDGGMYVVDRASELEVAWLVGSTVSEADPMVDLQAIASAADHAGPVALVDEGSKPAPRPA